MLMRAVRGRFYVLLRIDWSLFDFINVIFFVFTSSFSLSCVRRNVSYVVVCSWNSNKRSLGQNSKLRAAISASQCAHCCAQLRYSTYVPNFEFQGLCKHYITKHCIYFYILNCFILPFWCRLCGTHSSEQSVSVIAAAGRSVVISLDSLRAELSQ